MGKILIDPKLLGINFMATVFTVVHNLCLEKGLNPDIIEKRLAEAPTQESFMEIIQELFPEDLKILSI